MVSNSSAECDKQLLSRVFWVGLGCKKNTPKSLIEEAMRSVFSAHLLPESAIAGIATLDIKRNEAGLIEFCVDHSLPLFFYSAEVLRSVAVPHPSSTIDRAVGTPSVAEAAALLACWEEVERRADQANAETQRRGDSFPTDLSTSYARHPTPILHIPKCHYRIAEQSGTVTIAVAQVWQAL
ncbi:MAG: cobalamin biosynthesis protein [Leptolyngbya sp. BL-A-14]